MRAGAAAVLVPVVLACVWLGGPVFDLLLLLIGGLMVWEWCRLVYQSEERTGQMIAHGSAVAGALACSRVDFLNTTLMLLLAGWGASLILSSMKGHSLSLWRVVGVPYITLPVLSLFFLRLDATSGLLAILWLFLVVWSTDTFAYFAGRLVGGPKLSPRFSPKKTWSGLLGGAAGAAIVAAAVGYWNGLQNPWGLAILGAVVAVISQCGDIFESAAKRIFDVKDSSNLIPGHGGVLDRLDGLVVAAVFCAGLGFALTGDIRNAAHFLSW